MGTIKDTSRRHTKHKHHLVRITPCPPPATVSVAIPLTRKACRPPQPCPTSTVTNNLCRPPRRRRCGRRRSPAVPRVPCLRQCQLRRQISQGRSLDWRACLPARPLRRVSRCSPIRYRRRICPQGLPMETATVVSSTALKSRPDHRRVHRHRPDTPLPRGLICPIYRRRSRRASPVFPAPAPRRTRAAVAPDHGPRTRQRPQTAARRAFSA